MKEASTFRPDSVAIFMASLDLSVVILFLMVSRIFCEPDSSPKHTQLHPASLMVFSTRGLIVSTRE